MKMFKTLNSTHLLAGLALLFGIYYLFSISRQTYTAEGFFGMDSENSDNDKHGSNNDGDNDDGENDDDNDNGNSHPNAKTIKLLTKSISQGEKFLIAMLEKAKTPSDLTKSQEFLNKAIQGYNTLNTCLSIVKNNGNSGGLTHMF